MIKEIVIVDFNGGIINIKETTTNMYNANDNLLMSWYESDFDNDGTVSNTRKTTYRG